MALGPGDNEYRLNFLLRALCNALCTDKRPLWDVPHPRLSEPPASGRTICLIQLIASPRNNITSQLAAPSAFRS